MFMVFSLYTLVTSRKIFPNRVSFRCCRTFFSSPETPSAKSSTITSAMLPSITFSFFTINNVFSRISLSSRVWSAVRVARFPSW